MGLGLLCPVKVESEEKLGGERFELIVLQISSISRLIPAKSVYTIHLLQVSGCAEENKIEPKSEMCLLSPCVSLLFFKRTDLEGFSVRNNCLNLNHQEVVIHHSDLLNPCVQTLKLQNTQKLLQPWDFFGASVLHFLSGLIDSAASSI